MLGEWIYKLTRWMLGGIFMYAGTIKLFQPEVFAALIDAFGMIPEDLVMPAAIILPVLEVLAGFGLFIDLEGSLSAISGLLLIFIASLALGIWMELDVDCGCFGPEDPEAEAFHGLRISLYRDLVMLAGVVFMYGWRRYKVIKPMAIRNIRFGFK